MEGEDAVCPCEVAIIGAGPYGLSAATYLKAAGVQTRVFGQTNTVCLLACFFGQIGAPPISRIQTAN
jgi:thioredoxin reductase